jgi:hypothetical protein
MMFAVIERREAKMAAGLVGYRTTELANRVR